MLTGACRAAGLFQSAPNEGLSSSTPVMMWPRGRDRQKQATNFGQPWAQRHTRHTLSERMLDYVPLEETTSIYWPCDLTHCFLCAAQVEDGVLSGCHKFHNWTAVRNSGCLDHLNYMADI